jgi:WD40 repeat protein
LAAVISLAAPTIVAQEKPADPAAAKVTYEEHVRPIFREHCFTCHGQDNIKGGLSLMTFSKTTEGGSSGEVIFAGEPDSSRLWALVSHAEEPFMPPEQDRLPDDKLAVIRKWIEGGALENAGSVSTVKKKTSLALAAPTHRGKPEGPAAMPESLLKQPVVYSDRAAAVTALAASPWAPLVAVAGQKQVALYHGESAALLGVLPFPEGVPHVLRFSADGELLLVGGGHAAQLGIAAVYDVRSGKRLVTVGDELDVVLAADMNDDRSRIALAGPQKVVRVYDTATGELVHEMRKHTDWVYDVRFSPDGVLLASCDRNGGLVVWETATGREYLDLRGHGGAVRAVAWRSDSNVLASASEDGTVRLWEMNDGNQIKNWGAHGGGAMSVSIAQDGRLVTAGRDNTVKVWDADGNLQATMPALPEMALAAAMTHDGSRVIGGDWTGQVLMWNTADPQQVVPLAANPPTLEMVVERTTQAAQAASAEAAKAAEQLAVAENAAAQASAAAVAASQQVTAADEAAKQREAERVEGAKAIEQTAAAVTAAEQVLATAQAALAAAQQAGQAEEIAKAESAVAAALAELAKAQAVKAEAEKVLAEKTALAAQAAEAIVAARAEAEKRAAEQSQAGAQLEQQKAAAQAAAQRAAAAGAAAAAAAADLEAFQQHGAKLAQAVAEAEREAQVAQEAFEDAQLRQEQAAAERASFLQAYPAQ